MFYYYELFYRGIGIFQYFTAIKQVTKQEIMEQAERFYLISKSDFPLIEYAKQIRMEEANLDIIIQLD